MNESRELKNAEQLEELLLLTEEIQEELEQKDQLIVELKTQLNESLILNEKLNKENRAGNIQALTKIKQDTFLSKFILISNPSRRWNRSLPDLSRRDGSLNNTI